MAKTLSVAVLFLLVLSLLPSCKKCYTCVNACSVCTLRDTATGAVLESQTLYSDSSYYTTLKATLIDSGYTCLKAPSTYSVSYCINGTKGEDQYLLYYESNGRYSCTLK